MLQVWREFKSCWRRAQSWGDDIWASALQSLANTKGGKCVAEAGRSLMCRMKRRGPRMLPCSTPEVTGRREDLVPSMEVFCTLLNIFLKDAMWDHWCLDSIAWSVAHHVEYCRKLYRSLDRVGELECWIWHSYRDERMWLRVAIGRIIQGWSQTGMVRGKDR